MGSTEALPNSETPLAFLPPLLANQVEVSRYLLTATCGMFAWDILTNLRNDYKLLTKYRIVFHTVVYFLSRMTSFAFVIGSMVHNTSPVGNCQTLQVALGICFAAAVPLTSLLFFFRVRAIFPNNKWIVTLFSFLWLGTVAGCFTVPFASRGVHIGPTDHCINTGVKPYSSSGVIIATVNDTLVFLCISWKVLSSSAIDESLRAKFQVFIRRNGLPVIARSLLQSGQEYYLVTVAVNILMMVTILTPSFPAIYRAMFPVPNVAIVNSMACRVHRDIKFGRISSAPSPTIHTFPLFPSALSNEKRISHDSHWTRMETELESGQNKVEDFKYGIRVSKSVYQAHDPPTAIPSDSPV